MHLRLLRRNLPSFLPSTCQAPALARVSGRFCENSPFEIYRHLSTPMTAASSIGARCVPVGRAPQKGCGIKQVKPLSRNTFSSIFLPSRCRTSGAIESLHRDPSNYIALDERSGGAGSPRAAKIGMQPPCLPALPRHTAVTLLRNSRAHDLKRPPGFGTRSPSRPA